MIISKKSILQMNQHSLKFAHSLSSVLESVVSNLNHPAIVAGPLTAADLTAARKHSTGRVLYLHRVIVGRDTCTGACETRSGCDCSVAQCPPCHGNCRQGRDCNADQADACAIEGGTFTGPVLSGSVLSMRRHRRARATVALALALAAAGYVAHIAWPLLAA